VVSADDPARKLARKSDDDDPRNNLVDLVRSNKMEVADAVHPRRLARKPARNDLDDPGLASKFFFKYK
jgi:hypothetical protein